MIINGKKLAQDIIEELKKLPKSDRMLAAVLVGDNAQSKSFLRQKEKMAQFLEMPFHLYQFNDSIPEEELIREIKKLGDDPDIGGIIVQLPLPAHYRRDVITAVINPRKDIDAMTSESKNFVSPLPVEVVKDVLQSVGESLSGKNIAIVGRGFLVGKPIIEWLEGNNISFELFHSKSDLTGLKNADIVITGVGRGGLVVSDMLKKTAGVIDFGYDFKDGKISGDFMPAESFNGWYTPTPGGTGPILVAEIFKNFYKLN